MRQSRAQVKTSTRIYESYLSLTKGNIWFLIWAAANVEHLFLHLASQCRQMLEAKRA